MDRTDDGQEPDEFATSRMPAVMFARPGAPAAPDEAPRRGRHALDTGDVPVPAPPIPSPEPPSPPAAADMAPPVPPAVDAPVDAVVDAAAVEEAAPEEPHLEEPDPAPRRERWRTVVRGAGELLVTGGVIVLLFVVYELFVTDLFTAHEQSRLADRLHATWQAGPAAAAEVEPAIGAPVAVLHIPRLGSDFQRVIVEGTDQTQLAEGPGHYVGTAMPGQQGNLALAGHRVGKGSPFLDLDTMRPGDPIVVETATQWFVYRVLGDTATGGFGGDASGIPGQEVVQPTGLQVISPTPDAAATAPASGAYLTITTCNPKFSAQTRLVVHARLDGAPVSKASAPQGPPALHG